MINWYKKAIKISQITSNIDVNDVPHVSNWHQRLIKLAQDGQEVSGPGIKAMQSLFHDMLGRGAPTEYDDYGFNKNDWMAYQRLNSAGYLNSDSIPVSIAVTMLRILGNYRNTQITNYKDIEALVKADFAKASQSQGQGQTQTSGNNAMIYDLQPREYGKLRVSIPGEFNNRSLVMKMNKIVDAAFEAEGVEKDLDQWGKFVYPRYLKLSRDKNTLNSYRVHDSILDQIVALLESLGIIVLLESDQLKEPGGESGGASGTEEPEATEATEDIIIIEETSNQYGNKLAIRFNVDFKRSKAAWDALKGAGLSPRGIAFTKEGKDVTLLVNIDDRGLFDQVTESIRKSNLDVTPLENYAKQKWGDAPDVNPNTAGQPSDTDQNTDNKSGLITFVDLDGDKLQIKVEKFARNMTPKDEAFLRENVKYSFPGNTFDYGKGRSNAYTVQGNYKQYVTFGQTLGKFGYDVTELRKIIRDKKNSGRLEATKWEGQFDKDEEFLENIDKRLPNSQFELYPEQKEGVRFLYGRDQAILGDETGLGKTVQLISAAALKMQDDPSGGTLIVTLKATQKQWANEIISVMGEGEESDISMDPLNPKKWTVVYYDNFSKGKQVPNYIKSLSNANFMNVILDELHKVKHETSLTSKNIAKVVDNIPTRWGASATVSSNKPMDVKNQLTILGHPLGRIKDGQFKRDFGGMTATGYGNAYEPGPEEKQIESAERLNRWLNISGVYVRRSKADIREMPDISIEEQPTEIDRNAFNKFYEDRLQDVKNPDLPITQMIVAREVTAHLKTDPSTKDILNKVANGMQEGSDPADSKVVVFTLFVESGKQLVDKINNGLKQINPNFYVVPFLGTTTAKDRAKVKPTFTNDPNAKVLVMSMKMGGTGIDFPNAAKHMVINDFDWTPEAAEQSEGRIYRINTDHPVDIRYTVAEGFDAELFRRVQKKREISEIIQKYRKEYYDPNTKNAEEILNKIVDAQKAIREIDGQMTGIINGSFPGAIKK